MILTALLWGATIIAGIGIIGAFWSNLQDFVRRATRKVEEIVAGIVYGFKVFVKKMREGIREISRHYSKVDQHWEETTVTRTISESEVPPEILARANSNMELDITDEMEMQLTNA